MYKRSLILAAAFSAATMVQAQEMSALDTNADGVLSVEEFVTGYADIDPAAFSAIDANEDGFIDPAEYQVALQPGGALAEG